MLSEVLAPWRSSSHGHDPGKVLLDLVMAVAMGGNCLADNRGATRSRGCSGR